MKAILIIGLALGFMSCEPARFTENTYPSANVDQCPYGGIVVDSTPVCNGTPGNSVTGPKGDPGTSITGPQGNAGNGYAAGMLCDVYAIKATDENGTVNWNTLLSDGALKFSAVLTNFNVPNQSSNDIFANFTAAQQALIGPTNYALDCSGLLNVPETGSYTFTLGSDDGSEFALDNNVVINMPQLQSYATKTATVNLFAGQHKVNILYFQGPATNIGLQLSYSGPSNQGLGSSVLIPSSAFTH